MVFLSNVSFKVIVFRDGMLECSLLRILSISYVSFVFVHDSILPDVGRHLVPLSLSNSEPIGPLGRCSCPSHDDFIVRIIVDDIFHTSI